MKILRILIKDMFLILSAGISAFIGSWLFLQHQQPQIVYYTDEYYSKLKDLSVGSIFIVNEGRTHETNLSILIGEKILPSDVSIGYVSDQATIVPEGNKTRITILNLKPRESAEIVFRSRIGNDTFKIEDVTSNSGNIRHEEWTRSWWDFTELQWGIILLIATITFFVGHLIGLIKNHLLTKKVRKSSATRRG